MAICKLLPRNLVLQMPLTLTDYAWQKATLMQKFNFYIAKVPFLKRRILKSIGTNNLYIKCAGLESDRNPDAERKTSIYPVIIDKPDFAKIRQACKAKQVSVYSAIQTAASQAICEMIVQEASKRRIPVDELTDTSVMCAATVNRDDVTSRDDRSYISPTAYVISHVIDVQAYSNDSATFWQRAQAAHRNIRRNVDVRTMRSVTSVSAILGRLDRVFSTRASYPIELTNLGNCNYLNRERAAGVKVTAHFSSPALHHAGPVFANSTTAVNDRLCWSVAYFSNVTTKEPAVRYLHRSVEILLENCQ